MFTVYVLYSEPFDKIYIGFTSNLEQRFLSHNELGTIGWTIKFRPWRIVHTKEFDIKKRGYAKRKAAIKFSWPKLDT